MAQHHQGQLVELVAGREADDPYVRERFRVLVGRRTHPGFSRLEGKISFISSKAEFTPRNVQTAEDRSKLVYRVKIAVDNRQGVLKQGMPVEAEIPLQ